MPLPSILQQFTSKEYLRKQAALLKSKLSTQTVILGATGCALLLILLFTLIITSSSDSSDKKHTTTTTRVVDLSNRRHLHPALRYRLEHQRKMREQDQGYADESDEEASSSSTSSGDSTSNSRIHQEQERDQDSSSSSSSDQAKPASTFAPGKPNSAVLSSLTKNFSSRNHHHHRHRGTEVADTRGRVYFIPPRDAPKLADFQKVSYKPPTRYEPTLFHRESPIYKNNEYHSPLQQITDMRSLMAQELGSKDHPKLKQPLQAPLPRNWDGGYGWVFVEYHPSPFEKQWAEEARKVDTTERPWGTPLCDLRNKKFAREHEIYMDNLDRMTPNSGVAKERCDANKPPKDPMKFDDHVFSKFEYVYKCTRPPCHTPPPRDAPAQVGDRKFAYIEPLVGLLRHPNACLGPIEKWIVNKNYMIVDTWSLLNPSRSTISPPPRVIYVDGGASVWEQGLGGASQSWFHSIYRTQCCLNFTDWLMYEARFHEPVNVMKALPGEVKPGYRWYNTFLRTEPIHGNNPLNALLYEAKKEDVVILKIDFDTPEVELELLNKILMYPEVAELVDDLYFEHHVNTEIMHRYWMTADDDTRHMDSIDLFTKLRHKGVRAHSWV